MRELKLESWNTMSLYDNTNGYTSSQAHWLANGVEEKVVALIMHYPSINALEIMALCQIAVVSAFHRECSRGLRHLRRMWHPCLNG
jgi:hypothetical protein